MSIKVIDDNPDKEDSEEPEASKAQPKGRLTKRTQKLTTPAPPIPFSLIKALSKLESWLPNLAKEIKRSNEGYACV